MKSIRERLGREWLFCDGGSGTILQKKGLKGGELPELWNLTHPEEIKDLYKGYLNAGADIFNANTFGANILHYPENLEEVITAAITLAREAREETGREAYITLDMGPTGRLLKPMGDLDFEEAVNIYKKTVEYGVKARADVILIETMSDS
ncbi:MAG: homocysteine S-methyltransferase family protein, partial [Solobacterium sp.]|nr:homocysteine S-methyltransferase family protein [Solobacterium sp.]